VTLGTFRNAVVQHERFELMPARPAFEVKNGHGFVSSRRRPDPLGYLRWLSRRYPFTHSDQFVAQRDSGGN
jgi:hypothetical protein